MVNKLDLTIGSKEGRSYLKDTFFTRPFRIANVGENRPDPALYLMIMSSSPGILDKDNYDIDITTEPYTRLQLQSQSYQRLFKMQTGATQKMLIKVQKGSELSYVQQPIVPHEQSIFKAHNVVYLEEQTIFTYGEIITCGRKHSGEIFQFNKFQNLTEIYHNGKLILKDNILIEPQLMDMNTIGQLEGYTHQATLIHINTRVTNIEEEHMEYMSELLDKQSDILFGISQPHPNSLIIRMVGNGGEQLLNISKSVERFLWEHNSPE